MKKVMSILVMISICLLLVSCSNNEKLEDVTDKENEVSTEIDENLMQQLVGNWIGDPDATFPAYGKRTIIERDGYLFYDHNKLQIIRTEDNVISTQTEEKKPFYYDFVLSENKLSVNQWYSVPKGMTGGSLAPMEYMSDDKTEGDISLLYGEWESVDEPKTYYIVIKPVSDGVITYADNLKNNDSRNLIVQKYSEGVLSTVTEDEMAIYSFLYSDNGEMTASMEINENYYSKKGKEVPTGASKPIKYRKMNK